MAYQIKITRAKKSRLSEVDFDNIPFGKVFSDHMFVADYANGKWSNARIVPFGKFPIHPANMALHYGQSVFEGMKATKTVDGIPCLFRSEMHVQRINASASRLGMVEIPGDLFLQGLNELVAIDSDWIPTNAGSALYIRPYMFATDEFIGVQASQNYRFIIFTGPVGPYYSKPLNLVVEESYVRAPHGGVGEAKAAGNYAASLYPVKLAKDRGYDQVIWTDANEFKYVQEVGTMNLFFVLDGKVVTPATDGAILKGITRDTFLKILDYKNIPYEARPITVEELVNAHKAGKLHEAFGAGTAAVVSFIKEITYKGYKMTLPESKNCPVGNLLYQELAGLRNGTIRDTRGWLQPVKNKVLELA